MNIPIPPAALEAGARAMCRNAYKHLPEMSNQDTYTPDAEYWLDQARACFTAIVKAWEGMETSAPDPWSAPDRLILPLPQENTDDKA